jgi:type IV secretory pathway TraG/TraD family ATPase VirD4
MPNQQNERGWGPSHQLPRFREWPWWKWVLYGALFIALIGGISRPITVLVRLACAGVLVWRLVRRARRRRGTGTAVGVVSPTPASGVYLGINSKGSQKRSRSERAVLVIGPPRSGKTSSVIVPTLRTHDGPVISTSTKPDVLHAAVAERSAAGRVWQFDPTGRAAEVPGVETLRWSPLLSAGEWDGALLISRAMVDAAGVGTGTTDGSHWAKRSQALLASILHAAAVGGESMRTVVSWVATHDQDTALSRLREHAGSPLALDVLTGIANTEARERSAIFSTSADALDAYTSQTALNAAESPNFYAGRFVRSNDTVYIHAPAEAQRLAAPLVCGLLAEVRRATYQAHAARILDRQVLFALDEGCEHRTRRRAATDRLRRRKPRTPPTRSTPGPQSSPFQGGAPSPTGS